MESFETEIRLIKIFAEKEGWFAGLAEVHRSIFRNVPIPISKTMSISGHIDNPRIDGTYKICGNFKYDKKYGYQINVESAKHLLNDEMSIKSFLIRKVPGVGKKLANDIWDKFGLNTSDIIEHHHERLMEVPRINEDKAKAIYNAFTVDNFNFIITSLFHGNITDSKIRKIRQAYGDDAVKKIKENPYCLIKDIKGFGFKTVDQMAKDSGISASDSRRVKAAIIYTLDSIAENQGDCYIEIDNLAKEIKNLIEDLPVSDEVIVEQVTNLAKAGDIICEPCDDTVLVYSKNYYHAEGLLARKIKQLMDDKNVWYTPKNPIQSNVMQQIMSSIPVTLEDTQEEAVKNAVRNKVSIITGGPGTGKTTIIDAICKYAGAIGLNPVLLAPTGRAARRLREVTGIETADTIAKFIFSCKASNTTSVEDTLFVIDEASMIDVMVMYKLFDLVDISSSIVLVGDIDQLPPIGAGNVFRDMVNSPVIPKVKLKFTHRFSGTIADNARSINSGYGNFKTDDTFDYIKCSDNDERQKLILQEYYKALDENNGDYQKVQIIVPQRQRGATSSETLNQIIRNKLNPAVPGADEIGKFRKGDRIMQIKNDRNLNIANGDCGVILDVDMENNNLIIQMDDKQIIHYPEDSIENLRLAYAITIHKSQGSEYDTIITAYGTGDYIMLQRNLLYTAVTRAKNKIVMIADPKAIYRAVTNIQPIVRRTRLKERLLEK